MKRSDKDVDIDEKIIELKFAMDRLNPSYTRLTYILAKFNKEKQKNFKQDFEVLKKYSEGEVNHILFEDESMIKDYQSI